MGPQSAHRLVGVRPVERDRVRSPCDRIIQNLGVKGACPLGLLPPLGERGGHPRKYHRVDYTNDFNQAEIFIKGIIN
jgi:hypothetical protein